MTKKEIMKTLDISSYSALVIASIMVLCFEFFVEKILMRLAVILYGAAFLILAVLCILKLVYMKNKATEDGVLLVDEKAESKVWIIVRLVFAILCFAFMVVFSCMY